MARPLLRQRLVRPGPHERFDRSGAPRPVVAVLESRMKSELARLVEKHGGEALCVPAVQEAPELSPDVVAPWIDRLAEDRHEVVIFMTGVAVSRLFELAEQLGRRTELVESLRRLTTVCRGPKPSAALRGFGVPPTLTARDPYTTAELLDALGGVELGGRRVLLFHYGERSETLAETLIARRAELDELWLYRWAMPADPRPLEELVQRIVAGDVDALAVTCQIQFRHLHRVAERIERERALVRALGDSVVVGAVGPTCQAVLEAYGVRPAVVPDNPKMGPLVVTLMRHLDRRARREAPSSPTHAPVTH